MQTALFKDPVRTAL